MKAAKSTEGEVMQQPTTISIGKRFSIAFIGVVSLIMFFFAGIAMYVDNSTINSALEKRLDNAIKIATISLPTPLWNLDTIIVDEFISSLFLDEAMVYAEVIWDNEIITKRAAETFPEEFIESIDSHSNYLQQEREVFYQGNKVGTIRLIMSKESIKQRIALHILGIVNLSFFIITAIAITTYKITRNYITKPLLRLQNAAEHIALGNLDTVIEEMDQDEIGLLAGNLESMRGSIKVLFDELDASKKKLVEHSKTLEQTVEIRTNKLARSVDELKALSDVSQAISSTLNIDAVLARIVEKSVLLCEADGGSIFEFMEGEEIFLEKSNYGLSPDFEKTLGSARIYRGDKSAIGQAATNLSPVQICDLATVPDYPLDFVRNEGFRSLLALPMAREGQLIGGIVMLRKETGGFSPEVINLLQNFAAHSALAIHNAKLFREIEQTSVALVLANKHKSEFLANMSHELRTPLNAILGYTELLLDGIYGETSAEIEDIHHRLLSNGKHLLNLINDVLDISKMEAGQLVLSISPYSMTELIESACTSVEPLAAEKNLSLKVAITENLPPGSGDQQRITQVLMNLLGNAIKFTDHGEVKIDVCVQEDSFRVAVADTGRGISPGDIEQIFKEFRQADGSSTREKGGTGLGLAIAKKIVEMHGGQIWVKSTPDRGSTFEFQIPMHVQQQVGSS